MTRADGGKRAEWQRRLDDFEASGLTVAQFCRQVGVAPHTFYYWKKRVARSSEKRRDLAEGERVKKFGRQVAAMLMESQSNGALVTFTWGSTLRISVPAHCVDAIRCVLECTGQSGHGARNSMRTFQEVVLAE